jgi:fibronectin type 3 domain-containing protein
LLQPSFHEEIMLNAVLTWSATPTATSYTVYRSTTSGTQGSAIANVAAPGFNDATIVAGNTYFYSVTASNASGESPPSTQASLDVPNVPLAPTNLVATLGA